MSDIITSSAGCNKLPSLLKLVTFGQVIRILVHSELEVTWWVGVGGFKHENSGIKSLSISKHIFHL